MNEGVLQKLCVYVVSWPARDAVAYLYVAKAEDKLLGVAGTTDLIKVLDES